MIVRCLLFLFCCAPYVASAQVYKCIDKTGKTTYSGSPCPTDAKASQDISSTVGECRTLECRLRREKEAQNSELGLIRERRALQEKRLTIDAMASQVKLGMTATQVRAAWGEPHRVPVKGSYIETWEWDTKMEEKYRQPDCRYSKTPPSWYKGPPQTLYEICESKEMTRTVRKIRGVTFTKGVVTAIRED